MKKISYPVKLSWFFVAFILCINASAQFQKTYPSSPYDQEAQDVLPTSDGGYLLAGYTTNSNVNDCDVMIIKTDGAGNEQWRRTYRGNKPDVPYLKL